MVQGFILAGGVGRRFLPITYEMPKPLIPIKGKPVISYLIELYLESGIKDIKINIPSNHSALFYKWKQCCFPNENIDFLVEDSPSGTFIPLIKEKDWFTKTLVVSNGDELKDLALSDMISWHEKRNSLCTIGLVRVTNPSSYGVAVLEKEQIVKFIEKPKNPPSFFINSGLYIFDPKIKEYFLEKNFAMLEKDLFPLLARNKKLLGYCWKGKWQDVGTLSRWKEALKT